MKKKGEGVRGQDAGNDTKPASNCLFAAGFADGGPIADASPQLVPLPEEAGKTPPPVFPQCPGENVVLGFLLVLLHCVGQVPAAEATR